jgi:hypothetical protein
MKNLVPLAVVLFTVITSGFLGYKAGRSPTDPTWTMAGTTNHPNFWIRDDTRGNLVSVYEAEHAGHKYLVSEKGHIIHAEHCPCHTAPGVYLKDL